MPSLGLPVSGMPPTFAGIGVASPMSPATWEEPSPVGWPIAVVGRGMVVEVGAATPGVEFLGVSVALMAGELVGWAVTPVGVLTGVGVFVAGSIGMPVGVSVGGFGGPTGSPGSGVLVGVLR